MPTIPTNKKCATLGCKNPRSKLSPHCLEHGGKDTYTKERTEERKKLDSMYQLPFWKHARQVQLSTQPLCQCCLTRGLVTPATHVDHVFPWAKINRQAFFLNWFQSLCHDCHAHKTQQEAKGIARHYDSTEGYTDYFVIEWHNVVRRSESLEGTPSTH